MHYPDSHGSVIYTLLLFFTSIARGQTTTAFPAPALYPDGAFSVPDTVRFWILDQGTLLNVTWTTTYESVNLYLIFGGNYNSPKALTIGTTDTFFPWIVDDAGNNSMPFVFRAVNATGSAQDQALGGFITGQFWIRDTSDTSPTTPLATETTTHMNSRSNAISTTTTTPETHSMLSGTILGSTVPTTTSTSSAEIASSGSGKASTSVSSQSPTVSSRISGPTSSSEISASGTITKMTSPTQIQNSSPGPSTGAIAGIVIGSVAVLAVVIGVSLFFRRQRRPTISSGHLDLSDIQMAQRGHSDLDKLKYTLRDPSWDSSRKGPAELHEDQLVELPNYRSSRQHELP